MTEQERGAAFIEAVRALSVLYGFELVAGLRTETLGEVLQVRAALVLQPVRDWTPPLIEDVTDGKVGE